MRKVLYFTPSIFGLVFYSLLVVFSGFGAIHPGNRYRNAAGHSVDSVLHTVRECCQENIIRHKFDRPRTISASKKQTLPMVGCLLWHHFAII